MAFPIKKPASRPSMTCDERAFVKRFGTKARVVTYSGREDMVGLKVMGVSQGFQIQKNVKTGQRFIRIFEVLAGIAWPTPRCLPLRFSTSEHDLVPGLRPWVQ